MGVTILLDTVSSPTTRDFSSHDAYLGSTPLHFYRGEGAEYRTETIPLQPPQTDVRNNPNEMPSALGRYFAQGDFQLGQGQPYYHYNSSIGAKYLYSEGFDISEPGLLRHLNAVATAAGGALAANSSGRNAEAGGKEFIADGNEIRVYDVITGAVTTEDPHNGETAGPVYDLVAEGSLVYAALGANGIHVRSAAGAWSHWSDAEAILVSFLKDRIIATTDRILYELTAGGAPGTDDDKTTLREGWTFTDLGETGTRIYASAIKADAGLSKVFHYGLNASLVLEEQGSSWLPNGDLCYSILGHLGQMFLGVGRVNSSGGKDAIFYRSEPSEGFLPLTLVMDSQGAGANDLAVRALTTQGRKVLLGWTLGADSPFGVREGLAIYDPALDSFATHLASTTATPTPESVLAVTVFEGRIVFVTEDGVYYEDTSLKVAIATLISSIANFNNPGLKNWDESSLATKALPNTSSVQFNYSLSHPEEDVWAIAGTHDTPDATVASFRHANTESSRFAVKLVSYATTSQTDAPEIETYSVRSNPTVSETEYRLVRTIELKERIVRGQRGQAKRYNPREQRDYLRASLFTWNDWHESDSSYYLRLVQVGELKVLTDEVKTTKGDPYKEHYIVQVVLEGRESA